MKIALLTPNLNIGGAEKVILNLAKGFRNEGHSVYLICGSITGEYISQIPKDIIVIDLKISRMRYALVPLIKFLIKENPDILYTSFRLNNIIGILAKIISRNSVKVYVSEHGFEEFSKNLIGKTKALFVKFLYSKAESIISVSKGLAENISNELRLPSEKIITIYNPVIETEEGIDYLNIGGKDEWFNQSDIPVLLSVGRLAKIKGYQDLLLCFQDLLNYREARLVIIGEGPFRGELEKIICDLNLNDKVKLYGYVEKPYIYMSKCSVFVLTSYREGFGNVLVEALYCGAQIVSTNCPSGPAEILENGKYGKLVPVGNLKELTNSIIEVLDSKIFFENGKNRAQDFTINKISNEYLRLFEKEKNV